MLYDIVEARVIKNYILYLRFENNKEGNLDLSKFISFQGIFSPLKDIEYFSTVYVNRELGTIAWDNGADISPSYLYSLLPTQ